MGKKLKDILTPDKISILQESRVYLQDIVALFYNLKPLLRTGVSPWKFELFKETLSKLGFKLLTMEPCGPNKNHPLCLIGKSEKKLKKYHEVEIKNVGPIIKSPSNPFQIDKLLGYPSCCVKEFNNNMSINNIPTKTLSNTKGRLDFRLNYLYNFNNRSFDYQEFGHISNNYRLSNTYLIFHQPCSFNCKESINYAQKLLDILKLEFPEYYERLTSFLKKPILFFSDFVFFPLNGKMEGDTFRYKDFIKIHDRLPIETLNLLNKGNIIKKNNNHFKIYKDDLCIMDKLPENVRLFNFE